MSDEFGYYGERTYTYTKDECEKIMSDIVFSVDTGARYLTEKEQKALENKFKRKVHKKKYKNKKPIIFSKEIWDSTTVGIDDIAVKSQKFSNNNILSDEDKDLLIEYAPLLFKTSTSENIRKDMYQLVHLVWEYKLHSSPNFGLYYIRENFPKIYEKDQEKRVESFKENVNTLLELMGGDAISTIKGTELKKILVGTIESATEYIPTKPEIPSANKNIIKDYLFGLKLPNKSKVIKEFIKLL